LCLAGEFAAARRHLEQGIIIYDSQQHRFLAVLYGGEDPGVGCQSFAALALWFLGYPDQALQRSQEALTLAQELSHAYSLALTLDWAAWLYQYRREGQRTQERAEAAIALCSEQGFPFWLAKGTILRSWALAEQGQVKEGIAQMEQGLAALRARGAEVRLTWRLAMLAEAYGKVEQTEKGLTVLAEALATADNTGERFYEAELYRLKGELTLRSKISPGQVKISQDQSEITNSHPLVPTPQAEAAAEGCFQQALEIARRQSAKSLELRAAMSLSRLWQRQGKRTEAYELLAPTYGWFAEGFDTADLQEAKALLEVLA
jgi:predicted ATPase